MLHTIVSKTTHLGGVTKDKPITFKVAVSVKLETFSSSGASSGAAFAVFQERELLYVAQVLAVQWMKVSKRLKSLSIC